MILVFFSNASGPDVYCQWGEYEDIQVSRPIFGTVGDWVSSGGGQVERLPRPVFAFCFRLEHHRAADMLPRGCRGLLD